VASRDFEVDDDAVPEEMPPQPCEKQSVVECSYQGFVFVYIHYFLALAGIPFEINSKFTTQSNGQVMHAHSFMFSMSFSHHF